MSYRLVLSVALLLPTQGFAQATNRPASRTHWLATSSAPGTTSFGLKVGVSRSDLQNSGGSFLVSSFDYLPSFQGGLYVRHQFTRFAAGQVELLYMRQGFRGSDYNLPNGSTLPANRLDYVALPILFVGTVSPRLSFHLGPQAALLLAADYDTQQLDLHRSGYQRLDLSSVLGTEVRMGPARLGGRFAYSLLKLNSAGTTVTTAGQSLQVLASGNNYHSLVFQAYLSFALHTQERGVTL